MTVSTIEEAKKVWPEIAIGFAKDFTNQQFGKLTCLYRTENKSSNTMWVCLCECGNFKAIKARNLKDGTTKSCGCNTFKNISGQRFGKLVALKKVASRNDKTFWLCQCDCGNQKEIATNHLLSGLTQSCGTCNEFFNKKENRYCLNCGEKLTTNETKYCSTYCQNEYQRKQKVEKIFNGEISGLKNATTSHPKIRDDLRRYLLDAANYKCEECGCSWVNPYSNQTILEIHHIDGNRQNNLRENLKVLCPNCHAMTPNYKGLNVKKQNDTN